MEKDIVSASWFATHVRRLARMFAHRRPLLGCVSKYAAPCRAGDCRACGVGYRAAPRDGTDRVGTLRGHACCGAGAGIGGTNAVVAKTVGLRDVMQPGYHTFILLNAQ